MDTYEIRFSSGNKWLAVNCRALSALSAYKKASGMVPVGATIEIWKDNRCLYSHQDALAH